MGASAAKEEEPEPGDLIEISRFMYQHWAVYTGDGDIVHKTVPDIPGASSAASGLSVSGQVRKDKLQDVAKGCQCSINNLHDNKLTPRPKQEIVKEALSMVGKDVDYSLSNSNCEHFATECRYGEGLSLQVQRAAVVVEASVLASVASVAVAKNPSVLHSS